MRRMLLQVTVKWKLIVDEGFVFPPAGLGHLQGSLRPLNCGVGWARWSLEAVKELTMRLCERTFEALRLRMRRSSCVLVVLRRGASALDSPEENLSLY